jgi:hypothetical protein
MSALRTTAALALVAIGPIHLPGRPGRAGASLLGTD